jgi:hypothetical protein
MRYYSTERPLTPGAYPEMSQKPLNIVNFDDKCYCEEVGREAWGYIEYENPLASTVSQHYNLVQEGVFTWYSVTATYFEDGKLRTIGYSGTEESSEKPKEHDVKIGKSGRRITVKWFRPYSEAEAYYKKLKEERT